MKAQTPAIAAKDTEEVQWFEALDKGLNRPSADDRLFGAGAKSY